MLVLSVGTALVLSKLDIFHKATTSNVFTPPSFESAAVKGVPAPPSGIPYSPLSANGLFNVVLTPYFVVKSNTADVYLYNPQSNNVWLLMKVYTSDQKTLIYKSGILKPGQYLKSIQIPDAYAKDGIKLYVQILGYTPNTYYSAGNVSVDVTVQNY